MTDTLPDEYGCTCGFHTAKKRGFLLHFFIYVFAFWSNHTFYHRINGEMHWGGGKHP